MVEDKLRALIELLENKSRKQQLRQQRQLHRQQLQQQRELANEIIYGANDVIPGKKTFLCKVTLRCKHNTTFQNKDELEIYQALLW